MRSWLIGRSPDCDVVLDDQVVSGQHCRLVQKPDGFYLEDLGSANGTHVNGSVVTAPLRVSQQDVITLGQQFNFPWSSIPTANEVRVFTIGQADDNQIVLDEPVVSGHHARLVIEDNKLKIDDLGSTNGTFLGPDRRRIESALVEADDLVHFGSFAIAVRQLLSRVSVEVPTAKPLARVAVRSQPTLPVNSPPQPASPVKHNLPKHNLPKRVVVISASVIVTACAVLLVTVILIWSRGHSPNSSSPGEQQVDAPGSTSGKGTSSGPTGKTVGKPAGQTGFVLGTFRDADTIERIKVTIDVGQNGQSLQEPVHLDLGCGFVMRLAASSNTGSDSAVVAQKTSLDSGVAEIAAGTSAWFELSTDAAASGNGRALPKSLAFSAIRTIRFGAAGQTNWALQGYRIEINGKPFASHDSVNWRAMSDKTKLQKELKASITAKQALEKEVTGLATYIKSGKAITNDRNDLANKQQSLHKLTQQIAETRTKAAAPLRWYVERHPDLVRRAGSKR